jgi:Protein of unknown function (DUF2934)
MLDGFRCPAQLAPKSPPARGSTQPQHSKGASIMSAPATGRPAAIEQSNVESTKLLVSESTDQSLPVRIPSPQDIAVLAYSLWEKRGRPERSADVDWLDAERQLR